MQVQGLLRSEEQVRVLTEVSCVTDRAGFTHMEAALCHHRRVDDLPSVTWYGHNGTAVTATKKGDHYHLSYVALTTNDKELLSAVAAVCCHKEGRLTVANNDRDLVQKLRMKAATLLKEKAPVARSYTAAVDLLTGKWQ